MKNKTLLMCIGFLNRYSNIEKKNLNVKEILRFCSLSIKIHVVNFDNSANLTSTDEENHTLELLKDKKHAMKKHMVKIHDDCKMG